MVRTDEDLENMPPAERLKVLRQRAERRRKELEDLEKQKKEEELRELAELEETIRDLQEEEEKRFREEEEKKKKEQQEREASLEETVEEESTTTAPVQASNDSYSTQPLMPPGPNTTFYDLTNYNLYNKVKELSEKAGQEGITAEERNFLSGVAYHVNRIQREETYTSSQDPKSYLSRTGGLLKELEDKWK